MATKSNITPIIREVCKKHAPKSPADQTKIAAREMVKTLDKADQDRVFAMGVRQYVAVVRREMAQKAEKAAA